MTAWLEVVDPKGADRELDPERDFYVGRKKSNDLIVPLPALAENQFIVRFEKDGWRLIDLHGTPSSRVQINGQRMADRHRLQDGDLVSIAGLRVRFREDRKSPTQTLDALLADPDDDTLWQVHADELQERGDAFGEYLAHALRGEEPDRTPWLDDLFRREAIYGYLSLTWRRGVIESVVMRRRGLRETWDLAHLRLLVQSRVGQFVRHLSIDAPSARFTEGLAGLAELPPTLETISLGYSLASTFTPQPAPAALKQRCPRLRDASVYFLTPGLKLVSAKQTLVLLRRSHLLRTPEGTCTLDDPGVLPSLGSFVVDDACFWFRADYASTTQLNGRKVSDQTRLMLGDELVLATGERFRVEPNDSKESRYESPRPEGDAREFGGAL